MARAASRSTSTRSRDTSPDAIALLKQDHRLVEQLFKEFEDAEEGERSAIAERVCKLLTVHAQVEEELFYPAAREALEEDEEEQELVAEAEVEHASAKDLIAKIESMTEEDETFKATVKVLSEYIKHHVKEEESEMFPSVKKTELDLKALGAQLQDRKLALMEQMGIPQEEQMEETNGRSRAKRSGRGSTRGKSGARRRSSGRSSSRSSARH